MIFRWNAIQVSPESASVIISAKLCVEKKKKDTLYKRERVYEDLEKKGRRAYLIDCNNLELRMRVTQMRKEARLDK